MSFSLLRDMSNLVLKRASVKLTYEEAEFAVNKHFSTTNNRGFVSGLYVLFFNRVPKNNEEMNWVRMLDIDALNRSQVVQGFFDSDEFKQDKTLKVKVKIEEVTDGYLV